MSTIYQVPKPQPETVHQPFAPFTGSPQRKHCGGWIVCSQCWGLNNVYPLCPSCFRAATAPKP